MAKWTQKHHAAFRASIERRRELKSAAYRADFAAERVQEMSDEPKTIDQDTYLKALALFTLGHHHMIKCYEFETALFRTLGLNAEEARAGGTHLSDTMYSSDEKVDFDEALKRDGYVTEAPLTKG